MPIISNNNRLIYFTPGDIGIQALVIPALTTIFSNPIDASGFGEGLIGLYVPVINAVGVNLYTSAEWPQNGIWENVIYPFGMPILNATAAPVLRTFPSPYPFGPYWNYRIGLQNLTAWPLTFTAYLLFGTYRQKIFE